MTAFMSQFANFLPSFADWVDGQLETLQGNQQNITQAVELEIKSIKERFDKVETPKKKQCPAFVYATTSTDGLVPGGSEFSTGGKGGISGNLYICRTQHEGNLIPGKYHAGRKSCHISWGDKERSLGSDSNYVQVLRVNNLHNSHLQWVTSPSVPLYAVEGGKTTENEPLYVIRCLSKEQIRDEIEVVWIPGWFRRSEGAYTGYDLKKVKCQKNWQFLTCI